jgi:uncharacterized protein (TIGR02391 family)
MYELTQTIPDPNILVGLEPEELAAKLLFVLQKRRSADLHLSNLLLELWPSIPGQQHPYASCDRGLIDVAIAEAWAYLETLGLLIPAPQNPADGWRILSRRARRFENEIEFARYSVARLLPKKALHPRIAERVWMAFMRAEFDVAVFQAMKAVEIAVRQVAGYENHSKGVAMMRDAFRPELGPLTDRSAETGEQVARMELFAGAIGSYKNPHSHRDVDLDDPAEAMEIIFSANHLLRIVDTRGLARNTTPQKD